MEEIEPDWVITIRTSRVNCVHLVGGLHGPGDRGQNYECEVIQNEDGRCKEKFCPIKVEV